MIVESWVTMRGFALTSMWTEECKESHSKKCEGREEPSQRTAKVSTVSTESQGDMQDNTQEEIHDVCDGSTQTNEN